LLFGSFILVIDDEQDVRFAMRSILEQWGCHTLCVASIDDAITNLRTHLRGPDLIISDYQLREGRTGIEALDKLRDVLGEQTPAIIITGDIAAGDIQQVSQLGLPLVHKPVSPEHLRRLIIRTLPQTQVELNGANTF
jgi:two-component system, sensor histidine kinase